MRSAAKPLAVRAAVGRLDLQAHLLEQLAHLDGRVKADGHGVGVLAAAPAEGPPGFDALVGGVPTPVELFLRQRIPQAFAHPAAERLGVDLAALEPVIRRPIPEPLADRFRRKACRLSVRGYVSGRIPRAAISRCTSFGPVTSRDAIPTPAAAATFSGASSK